ncbi:zinc ABC transporter ATP-binding protein AztA [Nisaea acidiphila]|uniref:Zinc ABC transporter ATP-binding protein AztA n=1 Tax=Nisaea acidiphila TaxID=1862145 RepID=A0A9J7AWL2_9PROT|nr:zinc ABC transporter ATP-binding protein AztA [Nisaea acidiphila]UUX50833.1 zinc ABC transporter ATP-binding protein AztA [Nisaea acidiphila]
MGPSLTFENLTLGYDRHPAVHHLNATIDAGSLTAVTGPNGAGKSTLLKGIARSLAPYEGKISVCGQGHNRIAYLPQQSDIDRSFPVTVWDMVAMGLWRRVGAFRRLKNMDKHRVEGALNAVGLAGFEKRSIGSLSGGQMQRTLFARLLLQDASLILLDEPFAAIDEKTAADLLRLIARWHGEKRTIIAVLHDFDQVREHFPQTILLSRELVANGPSADVLTERNLTRARQLCEAFDEHAGICTRGRAA